MKFRKWWRIISPNDLSAPIFRNPQPVLPKEEVHQRVRTRKKEQVTSRGAYRPEANMVRRGVSNSDLIQGVVSFIYLIRSFSEQQNGIWCFTFSVSWWERLCGRQRSRSETETASYLARSESPF